jgi:hypothetical protein
VCKSVRIQNAVTGKGHTSRKRAVHYVAQGRAKWVDERMTMIWFIEDDHRNVAVEKSAELEARRVIPAVIERDTRTPNVPDFSYWQGRGCLRFWKDQVSPGMLGRVFA